MKEVAQGGEKEAVLVVGGSGFLGRHVVASLLHHTPPLDVVCLTRGERLHKGMTFSTTTNGVSPSPSFRPVPLHHFWKEANLTPTADDEEVGMFLGAKYTETRPEEGDKETVVGNSGHQLYQWCVPSLPFVHVPSTASSVGRKTDIERGLSDLLPRLRTADEERSSAIEVVSRCRCIVNLVGVKQANGQQNFYHAHVLMTQNLMCVARYLGIERFIHVSVIQQQAQEPDEVSIEEEAKRYNTYHSSKRRAEQLVKRSGLRYTVLQPAVIFGKGDDCISSLVRSIKFLPSLFPLVENGAAKHQPVHVWDVTECIVAAVNDRDGITWGKSYELVGPHRFTLKEMAVLVADGLSLPIVPHYTPLLVHRVVGYLSGKLLSEPLATPAQLTMLSQGMTGNADAAKIDLGQQGRPFTANFVANLQGDIPPLLGFSTRLFPSSQHMEWTSKCTSSINPKDHISLSVGLVLLLWLLSYLLPSNIWVVMLVFDMVSLPFCIYIYRERFAWRQLLAASKQCIIIGVLSAVILYMAARLAFTGVLVPIFPVLSQQRQMLKTWTEHLSPAFGIPLLSFVLCPVEDIIWRCVVLFPLLNHICGFAVRPNSNFEGGRAEDSQRGNCYFLATSEIRAWLACVAAALVYAASHLLVGPPLLVLAAFIMGTLWNLLTIRCGSLWPTILCHVLWDILTLYLFPFS
ncbi:hypothetical protein QOT17_020925 [Balamuthia mandrillaris]